MKKILIISLILLCSCITWGQAWTYIKTQEPYTNAIFVDNVRYSRYDGNFFGVKLNQFILKYKNQDNKKCRYMHIVVGGATVEDANLSFQNYLFDQPLKACDYYALDYMDTIDITQPDYSSRPGLHVLNGIYKAYIVVKQYDMLELKYLIKVQNPINNTCDHIDVTIEESYKNGKYVYSGQYKTEFKFADNRNVCNIM